MGIDPKLIDQLLAGYKKPEDIAGENGLLKQLRKAVLERALQAELTGHLGCEKHDPAGYKSGSSRNGKSQKKLNGDFGEIELETPRDRQGTFEPKIVAPHQTRWTDFDDKILSMYARGMSTREIQGHLEEIYHVDVSPALISSSIVVGPRPAFHETNPVAPKRPARPSLLRAGDDRYPRPFEEVRSIALVIVLNREGDGTAPGIFKSAFSAREECRDMARFYLQNRFGGPHTSSRKSPRVSHLRIVLGTISAGLRAVMNRTRNSFQGVTLQLRTHWALLWGSPHCRCGRAFTRRFMTLPH